MNYSKQEILTALGIDSLDAQMQEQLLEAFLTTLEMRTSQAVSSALSAEQLDEFNTLVEDKGDEAGEAWLQKHVPDYEGVEQQQLEILLAEMQSTGDPSLNI